MVLSVRPSVRCLSTQKSGYLAIYRVKRLLNTTVTLKSKKKCPGVYLIVAKAVPFAVSTALSFLTTGHSAILIRSQLQYDRGRAYTDSGHAFILAISHAHHFPDDIQIYTHTRALYTLRADTQPTTPSAQSAVLPGPMQVVNSAPRGMSLLETSSCLLHWTTVKGPANLYVPLIVYLWQSTEVCRLVVQCNRQEKL